MNNINQKEYDAYLAMIKLPEFAALNLKSEDFAQIYRTEKWKKLKVAFSFLKQLSDDQMCEKTLAESAVLNHRYERQMEIVNNFKNEVVAFFLEKEITVVESIGQQLKSAFLHLYSEYVTKYDWDCYLALISSNPKYLDKRITAKMTTFWEFDFNQLNALEMVVLGQNSDFLGIFEKYTKECYILLVECAFDKMGVELQPNHEYLKNKIIQSIQNGKIKYGRKVAKWFNEQKFIMVSHYSSEDKMLDDVISELKWEFQNLPMDSVRQLKKIPELAKILSEEPYVKQALKACNIFD